MKTTIKNSIKSLLYLFALLSWSGCDNDEARFSTPTIESITIHNGENISIPGSLEISAEVSDEVTPLSTLEIEVKNSAGILLSKTVRTKGNKASINKEIIDFPFLPNIKENEELELAFTLINVDGHQDVQTKKIRAIRPTLPDVLYILTEDENIALTKDPESGLYQSEKGSYQSQFAAHIATDDNLEEAAFIWGADSNNNSGKIVDQFGSKMEISFPTWLVDRIIFNPLTFAVTVEGQNVTLLINGKQMEGIGSYFYSKINFTKDAEFEITGIEETDKQYNRDFFAYNASTGKFTFLGETGTWDVYYSMKYKYFWVSRMSDVAPKCYWLIGHGFTNAATWHKGYESIGWDLDDPVQLAYCKSIGSNKYQTSVYLANTHEWGDFDIQICSNRTWEAAFGIFSDTSFTGDNTGIEYAGGKNADIVSSEGFIPGYYRLTIDVSEGLEKCKVHFERLSN